MSAEFEMAGLYRTMELPPRLPDADPTEAENLRSLIERLWPEDPTGLPPLTPELILALVRRRLRDLDGQLATLTHDLEQSTLLAGKISGELEALQAVRQVAYARGDDRININNSDDNLGTDENPMTAKEFLREQGIEPGVDIQITRDDRKEYITQEVLDAAIEQRQSQLQRANSGNEMRMVTLQALMQQRNEVVSLGTNILKQMHEASQSIIRNLV